MLALVLTTDTLMKARPADSGDDKDQTATSAEKMLPPTRCRRRNSCVVRQNDNKFGRGPSFNGTSTSHLGS